MLVIKQQATIHTQTKNEKKPKRGSSVGNGEKDYIGIPQVNRTKLSQTIIGTQHGKQQEGTDHTGGNKKV